MIKLLAAHSKDVVFAQSIQLPLDQDNYIMRIYKGIHTSAQTYNYTNGTLHFA